MGAKLTQCRKNQLRAAKVTLHKRRSTRRLERDLRDQRNPIHGTRLALDSCQIAVRRGSKPDGGNMRIRALLIASMMILLAGPAWAGPKDPSEERLRVRRATTILLSEKPDELTPDAFDVAPWLAQNLRFDQRGLKYVGRFGEKGKDRVVLRVRGPLMRKGHFGVTIDIRF